MQKLFIFIIVFILSLQICVYGNTGSADNFTGRWAEKISERIVMDIYSNQNNNEYQIFITWREDNLAQKDIYRFKAKSDLNGNLEYKDGVHIYRFYESRHQFKDKTDYTDGAGKFSINDNEIIWTDYKDNNNTVFIRANKDLLKDTTIKNKMFSITLPEELKGFYEVKKEKDRISVYHKDSEKAGFGGFAFGIKAYKNPADHAVLPGSRKIGELRSKPSKKYEDKLYDIVLKHPTDVQYDYTVDTKPSESYKMLYDIGDTINIQGINGSAYFKNQGMKGEDLYKNILQKHITAINEKWDSEKLEKENLSYMYNVLAQSEKNLLNKVGYTYYDINADGIEELLIGEISDGNWKGVIYDIYTMVNRKPQHVISGGTRNRYYVCDNSFICNEYSNGAMENGTRVLTLTENSTELFPQVSFKYDEYINPENPWFLSYGSEINEDKWENVTKDIFDERKKIFEKYERFDFIPLKNFLTSSNK